jgi:hypothetical protein
MVADCGWMVVTGESAGGNMDGFVSVEVGVGRVR